MRIKMLAGKEARIRQYAKAVKVGKCHPSRCPAKSSPVKLEWVTYNGNISVSHKIPFWEAMS